MPMSQPDTNPNLTPREMRLSQADRDKPPRTVRSWRESGMIGLWKDRDDIVDSVVFARELRERVWRRSNSDAT